MVNRSRGDEQARPDDLGNDPVQVGPESAGQSGDPQTLSRVPDADNESVEELADTDQAIEAARVAGVEDAADHPERPAHTHVDYGRPDDLPPRDGTNMESQTGVGVPVNDKPRREKEVEELSDEDRAA